MEGALVKHCSDSGRPSLTDGRPMMPRATSTAAHLKLTGDGCNAVLGPGSAREQAPLMSDDALLVLEAFVHQSDPDISYRELCEAWDLPVDIEALRTMSSST